MNRWVLLENKVSTGKSELIHYDFLIENKLDCLTWKFFTIPLLNHNFVEIFRQPNHRLVWLSRKEYELSRNRGIVKRIDHGTFNDIKRILDPQNFQVILDGKLLNGLFEISGNFCRLHQYNK